PRLTAIGMNPTWDDLHGQADCASRCGIRRFSTGGSGADKERKSSKKKETFGRGGLWKLPQLWKKAKRYAAFSHSCLDKTEQKTCSVLSTVTTGPAAVDKITENKKNRRQRLHTLESPFYC